MPGIFVADCLEILKEIHKQNRDIFLHTGGEQFSYIPALNDARHIDMPEVLVRGEQSNNT
ncbi:MAG: ferrochelatase [Candidatus Malihini olakiniferum]